MKKNQFLSLLVIELHVCWGTSFSERGKTGIIKVLGLLLLQELLHRLPLKTFNRGSPRRAQRLGYSITVSSVCLCRNLHFTSRLYKMGLIRRI